MLAEFTPESLDSRDRVHCKKHIVILLAWLNAVRISILASAWVRSAGRGERQRSACQLLGLGVLIAAIVLVTSTARARCGQPLAVCDQDGPRLHTRSC